MIARSPKGDMDTKEHWERVYGGKASQEFSWYQPVATPSLALLDRVPIGPHT